MAALLCGRWHEWVAWMLTILALGACDREAPAPAARAPSLEPVRAAAQFVSSAACRGCHPAAYDAWSGSHHDRAMQPASEETVLGNFADTTFERASERWEFFRRDGAFMVRTQGRDGSPGDFEVLYTFGVEPLQQYLVALSDGALHALTVAWDSRPAAAGGQRWFSLYPDEETPPGDVLHWTGVANRWNSMCADCHSTNLRRNFDPDEKRYDTTWSELDVACEACHGPGSLHVAWAESGGDPDTPDGLQVDLLAERNATWVMDPARGIARREPQRRAHAELETCAPCHSRRSPIHEAKPGPRFLDHYRPALLEDGLYFADGQIQDEVYVYGSFLQSKMYRAGVSCGDCHEPHSLTLRAEGDAVCSGCHAPARFATPEHHHHPQESAGARCVECHMPARTYMVIDDRRDHGLRVPRPDLSVELGTPNACNACHTDRDAEWAARQVATWSDGAPPRPDGYARALADGRRGAADAGAALRELARDADEPAIARATAVSLLARHPSAASADAIGRAARDPDALVRIGAIRAAEALPPGDRVERIGPLLGDPVRSVRIDAARALAPVPVTELPADAARARSRALAEYRRSQELYADEPSAHVNLGLLALAEGRPAEAERSYRKAIEVGAWFVPAYVNLADLYRRQQRDAEGEPVLRQAAALSPESADVQHALGLMLVRRDQIPEALAALERASQLAPESARFAYVYGVALNSTGDAERALGTLAAAHAQHPADRAILEALAAIHRDLGHAEQSREYLERLRALSAAQESAAPEGTR